MEEALALPVMSKVSVSSRSDGLMLMISHALVHEREAILTVLPVVRSTYRICCRSWSSLSSLGGNMLRHRVHAGMKETSIDSDAVRSEADVLAKT